MKRITIEVTASEWREIEQAAKFSEQTVCEFVKGWTMAGVSACEDDYIFDPNTGEVIGDRPEIEELAREALGGDQDDEQTD